jgi:hypothetical protein
MTKTRVILAFAAAICAFALSTTSASAFFKAKTYPTQGKATNTNTHVFNAGANVECTTATFVGVINQESSQFSVSPTYSGCKLEGFSTATVTTEGCFYNFHQAKTATTGEASVVCQPQKQITIKSLTCTIWVIGHPQESQKNQFLKLIKYTNITGTPNKVKVAAEVEGISFKSNGCLGIIATEASTGKYTGEALAESNNGADVEVV